MAQPLVRKVLLLRERDVQRVADVRFTQRHGSEAETFRYLLDKALQQEERAAAQK